MTRFYLLQEINSDFARRKQFSQYHAPHCLLQRLRTKSVDGTFRTYLTLPVLDVLRYRH